MEQFKNPMNSVFLGKMFTQREEEDKMKAWMETNPGIALEIKNWRQSAGNYVGEKEMTEGILNKGLGLRRTDENIYLLEPSIVPSMQPFDDLKRRVDKFLVFGFVLSKINTDTWELHSITKDTPREMIQSLVDHPTFVAFFPLVGNLIRHI